MKEFGLKLNGEQQMLNWLKNKFNTEEPQKPEVVEPQKSAKDIATEKAEPYISVVQVELDPDDVGNGSFELDWNEIFVARLVKAGFMQRKDDTDADIVDRWFQSICRNVINENYEQWEANQPVDARPRRVDRNDLGNGRTEIS